MYYCAKCGKNMLRRGYCPTCRKILGMSDKLGEIRPVPENCTRMLGIDRPGAGLGVTEEA